MKARPILFAAPMVRALLAGSKTQTRRIAKHLAVHRHCETCGLSEAEFMACEDGPCVLGPYTPSPRALLGCPYGIPGDLLWVRETWMHLPGGTIRDAAGGTIDVEDDRIVYAASGRRPNSQRWSPSIHMPRSASRLTLLITDVRVQRLREISEEDAKAEGAEWHDGGGIGHSGWRHDRDDGYVWDTARTSYFHLWNRINGEGSVARNDWTWALTFEVIKRNIDVREAV